MRGLLVPVSHDVQVIDVEAIDWDPQDVAELLACEEVSRVRVPQAQGEAALGLWRNTLVDGEAILINRGATALMKGGLPPSESIEGPVLVVGLNDDDSARSLDLSEMVRICTRLVRSEFQALPPGS